MPPGVGYRRSPMLSDRERRLAQSQTGQSQALAVSGGLRGLMQRPQATVPKWWEDPQGAQKMYDELYGPDAQRLGNVDPMLLEALTQRSVAEGGARQRSVLGGLRSSAAGAGPGQFGFLAALSDLQAGSDLSRATSDAYLGEAERARGFRERQYEGGLDFLRQFQMGHKRFEEQAELARLGSGLAERRAKSGRGLGLSLKFPGGAGGSVSFKDGGVATQPTRAVIGDAGEPEYVLRESQLLDLLSGGDGSSILGGRDLLTARMDAAREGVGTLGGGPRMGQPEIGGMQDFQMSGAPEPPIPYREPEAVKPRGFWESLSAYMPEVSSGPESSGGGHALALLANIARIPGATSMRRRGAQNERTKEFVKDLNSRQAMKYDAELDQYRYNSRPSRRTTSDNRPPEDEIYLPEIDEFVKKGGAAHNRYLSERLRKVFKDPAPPKKTTAPKRSAGLTTAVNYWKKRLLNVTMGADMRVMADELRAEPDSIQMAPEVQEALRLKMREFGLSK